jgi:polysaccharide export outer membrane protein
MTWNKTCLYTCFVLIFFTACTSSKKYDYFQANYNSKDKSTVLPFDVATAPIHIIDIGDVIEINYYTPDEINQSIMNTSDESEKKTKINLFTVNSEGYIEIPLIGTCKVLGCNIDDVKDTVTNRISKYFNIAYIQVKLNSFKINIIGEVTTPGIKNIYSSEINIIQAISIAGDVSQFGNKREVVLLRKENGKYRIYEIDLTDLNIVKSESFYLKSNDTIYIKPVRSKSLQNIYPILSLGLSLINTALIILQLTR